MIWRLDNEFDCNRAATRLEQLSEPQAGEHATYSCRHASDDYQRRDLAAFARSSAGAYRAVRPLLLRHPRFGCDAGSLHRLGLFLEHARADADLAKHVISVRRLQCHCRA